MRASPSICFDCAALFYDQNRHAPPTEASAALAQTALQLPGERRALWEVGTGRIAKLRTAQGAHVTGADLSLAMMGRLRKSSAGD